MPRALLDAEPDPPDETIRNLLSGTLGPYDDTGLYTTFRDVFGQPESALYAGSGTDTQPADVFEPGKDGRVVHVDRLPGHMEVLSEAGYAAEATSLDSYTPDQLHDLVIMRLPAFPAEDAAQHLGHGGYVLTDDKHMDLFADPDFRPVAALEQRVDGDGRTYAVDVVQSGLESYFRPAPSPETLQEQRPEMFQRLIRLMERHVVEAGEDVWFEDAWERFQDLPEVDELTTARPGIPKRAWAEPALPPIKSADRYVFRKER